MIERFKQIDFQRILIICTSLICFQILTIQHNEQINSACWQIMFFRSKCISTIFWSRKKKSHCLFRFPIFLELRDASSVYCVSSGVIYVGKPHKRWMPSLWVFYLMFIYIDFVYHAEQKLGEMGYLLYWNVFHLFGSYSISQLVSPSNLCISCLIMHSTYT